MLAFFRLAMLSPGRQVAFRRAVVAHLLLIGGATVAILYFGHLAPAVLLGHVLLVAGIVEGAALLGWRLTQLPKSQALEFLLISPLRPWRVFLAEAGTGLARLALVTLAGLPLLTLLAVTGRLHWLDLAPLIVMPFTWGALTGLGLTVWAYEKLSVRRWGEAAIMLMVLFYLLVGILIGEHLQRYLAWLPETFSHLFLRSFAAFHAYNPFGILQLWLDVDNPAGLYWEETVALQSAAMAVLGLLLGRGAIRFKEHFHDRHYRPAVDRRPSDADRVGNKPLSWWAVRRVMEYSGRVNLWLAGGFGVLYALYTVAGSYWPSWLGRVVFVMVEIGAGGIPTVATGLVVLAAVPAAFQYGLWDSNAQNRCRRLELLLLTALDGRDYWDAAAAAAWRRGRGYLLVALILWLAAMFAGRMTVVQVAAAISTSVILWGFYFVVGFRAFARGMQANGLGSLLTVGLPLLVYAFHLAGWPALGALLPPGSVYAAAKDAPAALTLVGPMVVAVVTLWIARRSLRNCDADLRLWYDRHHGSKVVE